MVFYLRTNQTTCQTPLGGNFDNSIDVEVPIQNNQFNLTGATCSGFIFTWYCSSGQQLPP
jgi:hypothetical protein